MGLHPLFRSKALAVLSLLTLGAAMPPHSAQRPPAAASPPAPELVGAGVLSTPDDEIGFALAPDGETAYFTLRSPTTTSRPITVICVTHRRGDRWSEPEIAPFSGRWDDASPAFSPDGRRLFFSSSRPVPGRAPRAGAPPDSDIWVMEKGAGGWSEPRDLGEPVDTPAAEQSPSVAADGTLYFASSRPGGKGGLDLWRARWLGGDRYAAPENLAAVDSDAYEGSPAIAPDQRLLVFTGAGRPDGLRGGGAPYDRADLYVSFQQGAGWTPPKILPPPINTAANESAPSFSPDGRWLYFTSERSAVEVPMPHPLTARGFDALRAGILSGSGNLYRVPLAAIEGGGANLMGNVATADERSPREPAAEAAVDAPAAIAADVRIAPTAEPRRLGAGVISTAADEFGGQLDTDGRTLFFNRSVPRSQLYTIWLTRAAGGRWAPPAVAPFSGTWRDFDPVLAADGRQLFFVSDRPLGATTGSYNLWALARTASGWSAPRPLPAPIDGVGSAHFASTTRDGTLYFTSTRPGNLGGADVWRARRRAGGGYAEPENLGPAVNGPQWTNLEAFVAADESYLIVSAFGHDDSLGDADLYVSYRRHGAWSKLRNLGPRINSAARDYSPRVISPAGGEPILVFASERGLPTAAARPTTHRELVAAMRRPGNGLGDLYAVAVRAALPPPR